jgi:hypothetical protein
MFCLETLKFQQSMMNLTLEGIFQAKQRHVVMGIPVPTGCLMMALGPIERATDTFTTYVLKID